MSNNEFVIRTINDDDDDLEDLRALQKVKNEIAKKKKTLKDREFLNQHPDLDSLVKEHRRKKIEVKLPESPEDKIELKVKESVPKLSEDFNKTKSKAAEFDYDKLAEKVYEKIQNNKAKSKPVLESVPEKPKAPTEKFNETLEKIPDKVVEKKPVHVVVTAGGKWF